jgi:sterol desaturase/sphingolipid hydroxylase (fatty acid hydroxylase superfamily)
MTSFERAPLAISARSIATRAAARSDFARRDSARILATATLGAGIGRVALGRYRRGDLAMAIAAVASEPFVEWVLHSGVLHARPKRLAGREIDSAQFHAGHHRDPDNLNLVLLRGREALASLGAIGGYVAALTVALGPLAKGSRLRVALTGCALGAGALLNYEATHYAIHCAVPKRSRRLRAAQRNHRLHHYRNEHYWFGVTNDLADRVLGTRPRSGAAVELSPTARTLSRS